MKGLYRADRLKGIMAARAITTTVLSEKTGLSRNTIAQLRKGSDTRVSKLVKVSKALKVPILYFFEEDAI